MIRPSESPQLEQHAGHELITTDVVSKVGEEYRLQTREGVEWERDFHKRYDQLLNNDAEIAQARTDLLKVKVQEAIGRPKILQGSAQVPRKIELFFGSQAPNPTGGVIPVWVRDGWTDDENIVKTVARQEGTSSPLSFLYLPRTRADELKKALASRKAAEEVLSHRGMPSSPEGQQARLAIETRQREADFRLDSLAGSILLDAKVWLAGGEEQPGLDLPTRITEGGRAAAVRLFPQFSTADSDKWDKVLERAKVGAADALKVISFNGDAHTHPVCTAVIGAVGAGKRGGEIIKHFDNSPYGWPTEAVCAALVLLSSSGYLRASQGGMLVEARHLSIQQLRSTDFRCETITLTARQKIAIREVFQKLGVSFANNREVESANACLHALQDAAQKAGGDPPAPAVPNPAYLEQLRGLSGNDFLLNLFNAKEEILKDLTEWQAQEKNLQQRSLRWTSLQKLLAHAKDLPEAQDLVSQAQAIVAHRSLLSEPDPVTPLVSGTSGLLRQRLTSVQDEAKKLQVENRTVLEASDLWKNLSAEQKQNLESRFALKELPAADVSSEAALLSSLDTFDLSRWKMLVEAIPQRFSNALQEAARLLEPQAITVRLPAATLHNEEEVNTYLKKVEEELKQKIKKGPVIIS